MFSLINTRYSQKLNNKNNTNFFKQHNIHCLSKKLDKITTDNVMVK